jgi:hypothetical protein
MDKEPRCNLVTPRASLDTNHVSSRAGEIDPTKVAATVISQFHIHEKYSILYSILYPYHDSGS